MTLSAEKFRFTYTQAGGGGTVVLPDVITCGEVVDTNIELDIMVLQDVTGSYPPEASVPFIREFSNCILTAWPQAYMGLCYFADFPIAPYGDPLYGDVPFGIQYPLSAVTSSNINSWTLPAMYGADTPEAQLDAIQSGAQSTAFGWREIVPGRKRIILLNTDTIPHDSSLEPGVPHTTRAAAVQACIDNSIFPIYIKTSSFDNTAYDLGYGISGNGTPADTNALIRQILTAIYIGTFSI